MLINKALRREHYAAYVHKLFKCIYYNTYEFITKIMNCLKGNIKMADARNKYWAKNMLVKKLEENVETGFLEVSVYSERNREPVSNANITIYLYEVRGIYQEAATENVIASYTTDEYGKIPVVELPVIHVLGKPEENTDGYHLKVEASGYYTVIIINFEIFSNTTTSFNVVLTPVVTGEDYTEYIIIPEKH